jgi:hypothetical protein
MINNNGHWPYRVEVGDIVEDAKGNQRTVISATQCESGFTGYVSLPIARKSWTNRPYTTLTYTDMQYRGFKPVAKAGRIPALMVSLMIEASKAYIRKSDRKRHLFAQDVVGVLR